MGRKGEVSDNRVHLEPDKCSDHYRSILLQHSLTPVWREREREMEGESEKERSWENKDRREREREEAVVLIHVSDFR